MIINFAIIGLNYNDRANIIEEHNQVNERWKEIQGAQLATLAERFPNVGQDEFKKAFKECTQYDDDDKKIKQYWAVRHTE